MILSVLYIFVCEPVRDLKAKPLELPTPKLADLYSVAGLDRALTIRSKC